ncbi:hypothetical protein [Streptomyces natalensis]|uniref:Uncharacterized protein n=1 Tax=Streptomyces natalensis ATCC 27448 TaxID=1240678 RepID=A0A0D7CL11_9ACTN|nr:hypothetical protein [Streptomyces natalensis]KIZ16868.1 hypothetical protein SNA_17940 [Streptomyces natalensis ATCC 27448]
MRPQRLMEFVAETLTNAPEVQRAVPWQEGGVRPYGVQVTFLTGAELWLGVMAQAAPGESYDEPEVPVTAEPPAEVAVPELLEGGKVTPLSAEAYIAAVLTNSGSAEIKRAYGYSEGATMTRPTSAPGVGLEFHSAGRGFLPFIHTARAGQGKGRQAFDLQEAF